MSGDRLHVLPLELEVMLGQAGLVRAGPDGSLVVFHGRVRQRYRQPTLRAAQRQDQRMLGAHTRYIGPGSSPGNASAVTHLHGLAQIRTTGPSTRRTLGGEPMP